MVVINLQLYQSRGRYNNLQNLKLFSYKRELLRLKKGGRLKNAKSHNNKGCQQSSNYTIKSRIKSRIKYICQTPRIC